MTEPWRRDGEMHHLHPVCREKVQGVLDACAREGIPFRMFEGYRSPHRLPLYEPDISVMIGAAIIAQRRNRTGDDPILVSAAYNAGGVYKSSKNAWCLRTYGDHLDRAAKWYGDACATLKENE